MSCACNPRIVRFGTWFTPFLEGSFIAGCKETTTDLHLVENSWLPPHRVGFFFLFSQDFSTKLDNNDKLSGSCQKLQTVQPGHCSRDFSCPVVWCRSVGSQDLVIRIWGWALAVAAWGVTAEGRGAAASEAATCTCYRHCRWKVWFWPALKSWTHCIDNGIILH